MKTKTQRQRENALLRANGYKHVAYYVGTSYRTKSGELVDRAFALRAIVQAASQSLAI